MTLKEKWLQAVIIAVIVAVAAVIISWIAIRNFEAGTFMIVRKVAE